MDLGLRGKVALVTAASKGLGRAVARELAAEGAAVVICARDERTLGAARDAIAAETGADVLAVPADVSRPEDVERLGAAAVERHGRVDILLTNAGGPPAGRFDTLAPEAWDAAYRLTLASVVHLVRAVLPGMRERRWGRILNVTSIAVKQPVDNLILSNAFRAAVTGLARTLANEVAEEGITVNNLLPGFTRTDRVEHLNAANAKAQGLTVEEVAARAVAQIPMRRYGEPTEFAALAAFLASERASYITGQNIAVDGGWIRGLI